MMAVLCFSRGQLSLADLVRSSDSHGRSGARSGGSLLVRPAPPHLRCADDRSDCRSDRSSLSDGPQPPPELATAGTVTGKRHAAAPPIGAECVACVVGVLGVLFKKTPTPAQTTYSQQGKVVLVPNRVQCAGPWCLGWPPCMCGTQRSSWSRRLTRM